MCVCERGGYVGRTVCSQHMVGSCCNSPRNPEHIIAASTIAHTRVIWLCTCITHAVIHSRLIAKHASHPGVGKREGGREGDG